MASKVSTVRRNRPRGAVRNGKPKHLLLKESLVEAIQKVADEREATWVATAENLLMNSPEVKKYLEQQTDEQSREQSA